MRSSGVIMHIASLPSKFGIGTLGEEAYRYVDFLKESKLKYWQVLPIGQTGYGDSPYQSFSAFAGNPYFIDFDLLYKERLLMKEDYENEHYSEDEEKIDYEYLFYIKYRILKVAYRNFKFMYSDANKGFNKFKKENSFWLEDYSLYMAIKEHFNMQSWQDWPDEVKKRSSLEKYKILLEDEINYWSFLQFQFFKQWNKLKKYANKLDIKIIGDMPIYVSQDSADVWSKQEDFLIDRNSSELLAVAGCPPDYFSETGQLWGNPIYNWDKMREDGFAWWIERIKYSFKIYDTLRIDHFRGFESFWQIPYGEKTAINGQWVKGPGVQFFNVVKKEIDNLDIIAEDLGLITDEVRNLLKETNFPGMKVMQFAFDKSLDNEYLPHNYEKNCVVYTGTHDNDTFKGWFETSGEKEEVQICKDYLGLNEKEGYNFGFIRGAWSSISNLSIAPMQDFLNLGEVARLNKPSTLGENWCWRMKKNAITKDLIKKIQMYNKLYGRANV